MSVKMLLLAAVGLVMLQLVHSEMTDEIKTQLMTLHNGHRANLSASNMFKMQWDDDLAKKAEQWNNACVYKHKGLGENLAWNKPAKPLPTNEMVDIAFNAWYEEKNLHSYGSGMCYTTASCHYTQLAWHDTTRVGCSYRICSNLANAAAGAWWIVCMYSPEGNMKGEKVFEKGTPCSHADCSGMPCENNLCAGEKKKVCEDTSENCPQWKINNQCQANKKYMMGACPKSCGACEADEGEEGNASNSGCKDENESKCATWAKSGECQSNPTYMLPNCKKSCGQC